MAFALKIFENVLIMGDTNALVLQISLEFSLED